MTQKNPKEKKSVESMLERLEEVVRLLEQGDQPLETSLVLYEEGCALIRECMTSLDKAEQIVVKWQKTVGGERMETPFLPEEG